MASRKPQPRKKVGSREGHRYGGIVLVPAPGVKLLPHPTRRPTPREVALDELEAKILKGLPESEAGTAPQLHPDAAKAILFQMIATLQGRMMMLRNSAASIDAHLQTDEYRKGAEKRQADGHLLDTRVGNVTARQRGQRDGSRKEADKLERDIQAIQMLLGLGSLPLAGGDIDTIIGRVLVTLPEVQKKTLAQADTGRVLQLLAALRKAFDATLTEALLRMVRNDVSGLLNTPWPEAAGPQ